jgi:hypothetical protein
LTGHYSCGIDDSLTLWREYRPEQVDPGVWVHAGLLTVITFMLVEETALSRSSVYTKD